MDSDRELLELAAKAAGAAGVLFCPDGAMVQWSPNLRGYQFWNPLTDDGDALRLAVRLRLNINFEEFDGVEYACAVPRKTHQGYDEPIGDDEAADARRAIVRAAAEISRGMGGKTK